jgi:hypothetical protein
MNEGYIAIYRCWFKRCPLSVMTPCDCCPGCEEQTSVLKLVQYYLLKGKSNE